jgi:hypothetical protein
VIRGIRIEIGQFKYSYEDLIVTWVEFMKQLSRQLTLGTAQTSVYPEGHPTLIKAKFSNNDDVTDCLRHLSYVDVIVHETIPGICLWGTSCNENQRRSAKYRAAPSITV